MERKILALLAASSLPLILASSTSAAAVKFTVGNFQTHQLAQVESETTLETFTGRTDKVTGAIQFDPKTRTGGGRIVVDAASIDTGIDLRNQHLRGEQWLDTDKSPQIVFETTKVQFVRGDTYRVTGKFTLRGVTKTLTADATVKHLKESDATRKAGFKGDVLQVKTAFPVKLSDFGIKISGPATGKVNNQVRIAITVYGQSG